MPFRTLSLIGFGAAICASLAAQSRIRVECVDAQGRPVSGAEVRIAQWRMDPDGSGRYLCSKPFVAGEDGVAETVLAETYGGDRFQRWVVVRVPGELVGALRCDERSAPGDGTRLRVPLGPTRTLEGRITAPDGVAVAGATVALQTLASAPHGIPEVYFPRTPAEPGLDSAWPEWFETRTDANGAFRFVDLPQRCWLSFSAQAPGLARAEWVPDAKAGRRLDGPVTLSLAEAQRIEGVAVDADGKPRAGVRVVVRRWGDGQSRLPFEAVSDAKGAFRIEGLSVGDYEISASVDASPAGPGGAMLVKRVTVGERAERVDVELEPVRTITGYVVDRDGRRVAGVDLDVVIWQGPRRFSPRSSWPSTTSDAEGAFRLVLPECECDILACDPGLSPFEKLLEVTKVPATGVEGPVRVQFGGPRGAR